MSDVTRHQGLGEVCLDRLVATTYVANVDEPTLSIIVPVLMRGLRVRGNANVVRSTGLVCGFNPVADSHIHGSIPFSLHAAHCRQQELAQP